MGASSLKENFKTDSETVSHSFLFHNRTYLRRSHWLEMSKCWVVFPISDCLASLPPVSLLIPFYQTLFVLETQKKE
jgi:hypothetical protein